MRTGQENEIRSNPTCRCYHSHFYMDRKDLSWIGGILMDYINMAHAGLLTVGELNKLIDMWHTDYTRQTINVSLQEYIGFTDNEYVDWMSGNRTLADIIRDRQK
jgi:hypothetical protein